MPGLLIPAPGPGRPLDLARRERLVARQRAWRRRARRALRGIARTIVAAGLLTAGALAVRAVGDWARTTPRLAVTRVEVVGAHRVDAAEILAATGLGPGSNLLTLDPAAVAARAAAVPGVRRAAVVRRLPGQVTVLVEEREPRVLVHPAGTAPATLSWVDAEGFPVGPAPRPGVPPGPVLSGVRLPADPTAPDGEPLRVGLALLRALERVGPRLVARVSEVAVAAAGDPVLYTGDGTTVRLGPGPWDERLARLEGVLAELEARGERVAEVDLRFRDLVVLRPHPGPGGPGRAARPTGRAA